MPEFALLLLDFPLLLLRLMLPVVAPEPISSDSVAASEAVSLGLAVCLGLSLAACGLFEGL